MDDYSHLPTLDEDGALERLGGDREMFSMLQVMMLEEMPPLLAQIGESIDREDAAALRLHAHSMKGCSAQLGGERVREIALSLERMGEAGELREAGPHFDLLSMEWEKLRAQLQVQTA